MIKNDYYFITGILLLTAILVYPLTKEAFFSFTDQYVLVGGFIKFFIFASIGDIISHRIRQKNYHVIGLLPKAIIWGFIGIVIVYVFRIFTEGVYYLQSENLLPFFGIPFFFAFFTSLFMNLIFAPTMMLFHRITDHYIEHKNSDINHSFYSTILQVDYQKFVTFVVFKTIPLFWIPAHTITFLLPENYRVFFASILGVMLGLILGFAKQQKKEVN
ncbi:MAG: hypothetical protein ACNA7U_04745 [Candidatus Izemoplasmataceae bacterium]|jgi:hypothetical protein